MIRIYCCHIAALTESKAAWSLVPRSRRERRYPREADRRRNLAAGLLLRRVLGVREDADLAYTRHGKPYLAAGGLCFNLAHAGDIVGLAVGKNPLGFDVEKPEEVPSTLAERTLTPEEWGHYSREGREAFFWECWTRKESVLKALGVGLLHNPRRIAVWPGGHARVVEREFCVRSGRIWGHIWSVAQEGEAQPLEFLTINTAILACP